MKRASRIAGHAVGWTTVAALVVVAAVAVLSCLGIWSKFINVEGGSMQPAIPNGSLLWSTSQKVDTLHPGDVVSVTDRNGVRVTHRFVSLDPQTGGIILKGDANRTADMTPYQVEEVDRIRIVLPWVGAASMGVKMFLGNRLLDTALVVLAVVVFWPARRQVLAEASP